MAPFQQLSIAVIHHFDKYLLQTIGASPEWNKIPSLKKILNPLPKCWVKWIRLNHYAHLPKTRICYCFYTCNRNVAKCGILSWNAIKLSSTALQDRSPMSESHPPIDSPSLLRSSARRPVYFSPQIRAVGCPPCLSFPAAAPRTSQVSPDWWSEKISLSDAPRSTPWSLSFDPADFHTPLCHCPAH